ncbi:hypothetical protein [Flavivirga eckloniae]|uniref:DUF4249 domain-containing protein n=1 Tax=Flavivirga eckloniae TaxID=1803846 RepID=A0A2K9PXU2_9FLAO|nr:hypothetical protein [Flavivirga eckloniae]AUP81357.1 hypothetical protein C1H87_22605 [Flavivirga eckloniae]
MKRYILIILLVSFFSLSGCDDVLDCIVNVRPELHDKDLSVGLVDEYYSDFISAEIKNEVNDNAYDYYFDVSGRLPEGIEVFYNRHREVLFKGVPKESGRFAIRVFLEVVPHYDPYEDDRVNGPLCTDETSRTYTLYID